MTEAIYVSQCTVQKIEGVHRRAELPTGAVVDFGVHGPIKAHYKLESQPDLPLPVDLVVGAAGG